MFGKNGGDKFTLEYDQQTNCTALIRHPDGKPVVWQSCPGLGGFCSDTCPRFHIRENSDGCVVLLQCAAQPTEIWITR